MSDLDDERRRLRKACVACRKLKLVCDYSSKKRGRISTRTQDYEPSSASMPMMMGPPPPHQPQPLASSALSATGPSPTDQIFSQLAGARPSSTGERSYALSNVGPDTESPGQQEEPTGVTQHLEPHLGFEDSRPPSPIRNAARAAAAGSSRFGVAGPANARPGCPIWLGILSAEEARFLYRYFIARMTEISHLFDPAYHTFERVRETSSLFTAILGVAARYRRPDLASPLLEHAERLMQRSLYDGQVDLAFVQTNIVMVHWKHPDDKSAYMKLGMAFRAAAQLRLGATMFQPLPVEVTAARARLDRERTWLVLFAYEMAYSGIFRLPAMFHSSLRPSAAEVEDWHRRHQHLNLPGDLHMAMTYSYQEALEKNAVPVYGILRNLDAHSPKAEMDLNVVFDRWLQDPRVVGLPRQILLLSRHIIMLVFRVQDVYKDLTHETKTNFLNAIDRSHCLALELSYSGHLQFLSDVSLVGTVLPAYFLFQLRHVFDRDELVRAIKHLRGFADLELHLDDTYPDHALGHVVKTYNRVLKAFDRLLRQSDRESANNNGQPAVDAFLNPESFDLDPFWNLLWGVPDDQSSLWPLS